MNLKTQLSADADVPVSKPKPDAPLVCQCGPRFIRGSVYLGVPVCCSCGLLNPEARR